MGSTDSIIRIILAIVFAVLYFSNLITGTLGIVLLAVAAVFLITSIFRFCPLYPIIGLNTCKSTDKK